ncbi:MAG: hypothetical protein KGY51_11460 [Psychroflexus sp.]|nr:hypothetical protein [Psychroflexus sp.]
MSYDNRIIEYGKLTRSGVGGIIDFDKQNLGNIFFDTLYKVDINFNKSKIYFKSDSISIDFRLYGKDSIEINLGKNLMHVFRPVNLSHKLNTDKREIEKYLIDNNFEKLNDLIDVEFSEKFFFRDVDFKKKNKKYTLINNSWKDRGYWLIKEIEENFFLIFTLDQTSDDHIYQIKSLDNCKVELLKLQEPEFGAKITELKTCL